jgi:hypothetical protein
MRGLKTADTCTVSQRRCILCSSSAAITQTDKSIWTFQNQMFSHSTQRAGISFVKCVTRFVENGKPTGSRNILFLLYEHSTHTKNIAALQLARDGGAIMLALPYHTIDRLQPFSVVFLGPWALISRNWSAVMGQNWTMHRSRKSGNILVMHREKQLL